MLLTRDNISDHATAVYAKHRQVLANTKKSLPRFFFDTVRQTLFDKILWCTLHAKFFDSRNFQKHGKGCIAKLFFATKNFRRLFLIPRHMVQQTFCTRQISSAEIFQNTSGFKNYKSAPWLFFGFVILWDKTFLHFLVIPSYNLLKLSRQKFWLVFSLFQVPSRSFPTVR